MTQSLAPSKSERTRARIFETAKSLFAERGFDGVSVRDIAEGANCDPALIMRYFGSKDGLFAEASEFNLRLPDVSGLSPEETARRLAAHFVAIWEDRETGARFQALLRSAPSHEPSATRLRTVFATQVVPALANERTDPQTLSAVSSVLLGFAMTRYVLRLPPIVEMPATHLSEYVFRCLRAILSNQPEAD